MISNHMLDRILYRQKIYFNTNLINAKQIRHLLPTDAASNPAGLADTFGTLAKVHSTTTRSTSTTTPT